MNITVAIKIGLLAKKHWKKLIVLSLILFFLPLLMFSTAATVAATVPALDETMMRLYINTAEEIGKDKSYINFKDLIAIDAVRYEQDFKKANKNNVRALAEKFLKEHREVTKYNLAPYKNAVSQVNSEIGVSIDWREVVMVDSLLRNEAFTSDIGAIKTLAKKFVRIDRIPYVVEETYTYTEKVVTKVWESWFDWMPEWMAQKFGMGEWIEKVEYIEKTGKRKVTKYKEGKTVIGYEKVLQDLGKNKDQIPEFFKDKGKIKEYMEKVIVTYSTRSMDEVMTMLNMSEDEKTRARLYRNTGLDVLIGGEEFNGSAENAPASVSEFIERVAPGAKETQKEYGVFASITIAQAALESGWGKSGLTQKGNALFGIKADSSWQGAYCEMETKEHVNGQVITITARFRAYNSWEESIKDHGKFLKENPRYTKAGMFKAKDYIGQAYALKDAGYATDENYPILLISLIQQYGLYQYDL